MNVLSQSKYNLDCNKKVWRPSKTFFRHLVGTGFVTLSTTGRLILVHPPLRDIFFSPTLLLMQVLNDAALHF